ncbi:MAG: serine hydrolase, partial [Planctomycetota bacterium]|nr:serine hydrolase [Planctomycetota bacterium]
MTTPLRLACAAALLGSGLAAQTVHYHDQTLSSHTASSRNLVPKGYQLISLDVSGTHKVQRYAAVWRKEAGPLVAWCAGYKKEDIGPWCDGWTSKGYRQKLITAAGSGTNTVFACLMVKDGRKVKFESAMPHARSTNPNAKKNFIDTHVLNQNTGYIMESAAVYGTSAAPLYAAVWVELPKSKPSAGPKPTLWGLSYNDSANNYQKKFAAFVTKTWARPAFVTQSANQRYLSSFTQDSVGSWVSIHNRTKASYESEVAKHTKNSRYPIQVSVAGTGSVARYAAIFATGKPVARKAAITGIAVPAFQDLDEFMLGKGAQPGFMQDNNAKSAAIAVAKDGKLAFARAYTYARPGYSITQPTTRFRIASCSKPLTALGIFDLVARDPKVKLDSKFADLVSLGTPKDKRVPKIELQHLINHRSGMDGTWRWSQIATNKLATARGSVQNQMLWADPGSKAKYSNTGYKMLGLVLETKNPGQSYFQTLQNRFFTPLGVRRARVISSNPVAGDARIEETIRFGNDKAVPPYPGRGILRIVSSSVHTGNPLINAAHHVTPQGSDASGGLVMSPVDYVRVLSGVFDANVTSSVVSATTRKTMIDMMKKSGLRGGWDGVEENSAKTYKFFRKGGLWHGAHAWVIRRNDGISIAAFCSFPKGPSRQQLNDFVDRALTKGWPNHDLFPRYGLPSFKLKYPGSADRYG